MRARQAPCHGATSLALFFTFCFETEFHGAVQTGLEFPVAQTGLNHPSTLASQVARVTGLCYTAWSLDSF